MIMHRPILHPRILISSPLDPEILPISQAFRNLGWEVKEFDSRVMSWRYKLYMKPIQRMVTHFRKNLDLFAESPFSIHRYREEKLRQAVACFHPEILLIVRGHGFSGELLDEIRSRYGVKRILGWWTKGSKWYPLAEAEAKDYDLFLFMNPDFVENLRQAGFAHCHYFPHAANTAFYHPLSSRQEIPVIFVGNWSPRRQRFIEVLRPLGPVVYGPRWKQSNWSNFSLWKSLRRSYLPPAQVNAQYNRSKVVLNMNVIDGPGNGSGWFTQRVFDVPASGSFLLTEYGEGLEAFFEIGEEIEVFRSEEELKDKTIYYLGNDEARERIARKGYEKVMQKWTWEIRAREIGNLILETLQKDGPK